MDKPIPEQWQRVKDLFDRVMSEGAAERARLIREADLPAELRDILSGMLAAAEEVDGFLERPATALLEQAPPPERLQPGRRIGNYRVIALIGSGGAGEVYLAERADGLYEQKVAIKRLRAEASQEWERFSAEQQILARLDHPSIARLLDAGIDADSRPYTVVEYVQGGGYLQHCAGLPLEQQLELFLQICDAVAYAHTRLVIHRDIKPGNLMISAEGRVKLLDFGVAKLLDPSSFRTGGQTVLAPFTPDYAAPEQIEGKVVSTATDVYSLGVVLFEQLTGRRPWAVRDLPLALAVDLLLHRTAPAASATVSANPAIVPQRLSGDLDAIIARALRKEPQDRYQTVEALAEDLRRHLRGEPVAARAGAHLYVAGRFLKRNRRGLAVAALILLVLAGAAAGYALHRQRQLALRLELAQTELRRSNSLNEFVALLLRPSGDGATADSRRQNLRAAVDQAFEIYRDQPSQLAAILLQIAGALVAADDTETASTILQRYLDHYRERGDPADIADIDDHLATAAVRRGDFTAAAHLEGEAQSFWLRDPERYHEALLSSRPNQAAIERGQGHTEESIRTLREALAERLREPQGGTTSLVLYQNLATTLAVANRPQETAQVLSEGWASFESLGQTRTPVALSFLTSWAIFATGRGELDEAERRYRDCVELRRALYGESLTLAAAQVGLGRVLALRNRMEEALPLLQQARAMGERYGGPKGVVVVGSWLFEADANLLRLDLAAAEGALQQGRAATAGQYPSEHPLNARLDEAEGRLRLAQGRYDEAQQALMRAEASFRHAGDSAGSFLSQTLLSRAVLLLQQGQVAAAVAPAEEAVGLRATAAASGTWLQAEAASVLGHALIASGQAARGMPILRGGTADIERTLGVEHPLARRARSWLTAADS